MKEHFQMYGYEITTDPSFQNKKYGVTPELAGQFENLHKKSLHPGDGKIIEQLTRLIIRYPSVPILKNFLSVAYNNLGNYKKAQEVNNWILAEHPDYLFARLNQAHGYIRNGEYEKVPLVLGEAMEIKMLYPERDVFHLTEVTGFLLAAVRYFTAIENLKLAENRLEILKEIAPDHHDTEQAETFLLPLRLLEGSKRWADEMKQRVAPDVKTVKKKYKKRPPEFIHSEIACLYENGIEIPHEKIREILALPRQTVVKDLETVLQDSVDRYAYFSNMDREEETHSFLLHALFLLMELESEESLPVVLKILEVDYDFIDFYLGDHKTDTLWQCLYKLGFNQTDVSKSFLVKPGIDNSGKVAVSDSLCQMVLHHPEKREEIAAVYQEVFTTFANASFDDNLIDNDFLGLAVGNVIDAKLHELLPVIETLFEKEIVTTGINGDFEKVEKYFIEPEKYSHKRKILNIFQLYECVLKTWAGYNEEKDKEEDNSFARQEPVKSEKIGRNDPCPCGSGKKYKKCCMNKE
jgi:hypothetical protein